MKGIHRWLVAGVVALLAGAFALGAVACGDDDKDGDEPTVTAGAPEETDVPSDSVAPGTLPVTALEYRFDAPATISGGLTDITLENVGAEDHQVQLAALNDGVTMDQLSEALDSDPGGSAALQLVTVAGGVNAVQGGGESEAIVDLEPGTYALICFISDAEDTPHFSLGMLSELEVTEATEEADTPPPDHAITATDYEFAPPSAVAPGETTMQFINSGTEAHELGVWALQEGFTVENILGLFSEDEPTAVPGEPTPTAGEEGPPPFTSAGGVGAIPPGGSAYWIQTLEPGNYALICFVPNADGVPHAALGMVSGFTVE